MWLSKLSLTNFRCFASQIFEFSSGLSVLYGKNGAGKTSLLEALYYTCYASSFRTSVRSDLLNSVATQGCIKLWLTDNSGYDIEVKIGLEINQRTVELNSKKIYSHKELCNLFKIVLLHQKDIELIVGGPEYRRSFLMQTSFLLSPEISDNIKSLRLNLKQRKAFLLSQDTAALRKVEYKAWTQKLWNASILIWGKHKHLVSLINHILKTVLSPAMNINVELIFAPGVRLTSQNSSFEEFWSIFNNNSLQRQELYTKRNLFGAHLDDIAILFNGLDAKRFASRGQQKIIVFAIKLAAIIALNESNKNSSAILFLIDDFFSELDAYNHKLCNEALKILRNTTQTFMAQPGAAGISIRKDAG